MHARTAPTEGPDHRGKETILVRAFVAIGGLLVVALLGVVIAPFFIDWTAYRADFEREASRILGHPVTVRGDASASILPFPSVTFTDVVVAGDAPTDTPLMTIAGFRMDAELAPYLSGEIRIYSMKLDRPKLRATLSRDGRIGFSDGSGTLPNGATVVLEDVEISDGTISIENGLTGRVHEISGVEARLSARSLAGPFSGTGSVTAGGERLAVTLSSGPMQAETGLPFKLTVDSPKLDASLVFDGSAKVADGAPQLAGTIRVTSPLPKSPVVATTQPFAAGGTEPQAAPAGKVGPLPPLDLAGKLNATPRRLDVAEMRVAVGGGETPYILTGSGSLSLSRLPTFTLDLEGEQVDVDEIAAEDAGGAPAPSGQTPARRVVSFDERLEAMRAVFSAVPRPSIPGTAKIALPVVVAGDTTIRGVSFSVSPTDTGWSVERFLAELPGRTRMEATGVVGLDRGLGFKGDLLVASRQPSGFADWLTGAVDPAIRALPQAGFSAKVDLSRERQVFDDLEVDVGGDALKGRLMRSGPREAREMSAEVSAGRMDLDALFALSRLFTGEDDSIADAGRFSLKIAAGPVSYGGAGADRIDADLAYDGSRLAIARLDLGNLAGANLKMSGELGGLGADVSGQMKVALDAAEPARAVEFLEGRLPPSPALATLAARAPSLGPLQLSGEVKTVEEAPGERPTLQADLTGTAAKTAIGIKLALGNGIYAKGTSGRFGLDLKLSNETPSVLLDQLGLDPLPVDTPSPLGIELSLSAGATGPVAASAAVRAPGSELTAEGTFDIATTGVTGAEFGLGAKSDDLQPWLLATGVSLGQSPVGAVPVELGGTLAFADGSLTLRNLSGTLAGTEIAAELERKGEGPVAGNVYLSELSMPWLATLVYGRTPDAGGAAWPDDGFQSPFLPPVDLALEVTSDRVRLTEGEAISDFAATLDATDGEIRLSGLQGAVGGGYVSGSAAMRNANGVGGFSLQAEFSGIDLGALSSKGDGAAAVTDATDAPPAPVAGTLDATLALDGTGQSYAALVSSLSGAGSASVEDGSFEGVRPGMFPSILAAADVEGFVPDNATAGGVVSSLAEGVRYPVPAAKAEFSVGAGVARFASTRLAGVGETLSGDGAIDLKDMSVSASLRLDLDPGDEAVDGAGPAILYTLSGPLDAPTLSANAQPLASYLSVRAFEREQARVEAMQEQLQERLRLRREARYFRWREATRVAAETAQAAAAEAERLRLGRQREEAERQARETAAAAEAEALLAREAEAARVPEAEVERAREAQAAREREAEAARAAETARRAAEAVSQGRALPPAAVPDRAPPAQRAEPRPPLDLENPVAPVRPPPAQPDFQSLPGVSNPLEF